MRWCPGRPRGSGRRARCRRRSRVENASTRPSRASRSRDVDEHARRARIPRRLKRVSGGISSPEHLRLWFCHGTSGSVWGSAPQPGGYRRPVTRRERENRARGEWQTYREITRAGAKRAGVESLEHRRREGRIEVRINPSGHSPTTNEMRERVGRDRDVSSASIDRGSPRKSTIGRQTNRQSPRASAAAARRAFNEPSHRRR